MPATLDAQMFPHILDLILEVCSHSTLTKFARTCKSIRERIFNRYLPVKRVILHVESGVFGVDRNNNAVPIKRRHVLRNRSGVQLIDFVGRSLDHDYALDLFLACLQPGNDLVIPSPRISNHIEVVLRSLQPAHVRIRLYEQVDLLVAVQRKTESNGYLAPTWTATFPFPFKDSSFKPQWAPTLYGCLHGIFDNLPKAFPGGQTILLMLENSDHTYKGENHVPYEYTFVKCLVNWLLDRPRVLQLTFVNIEEWLKLRHPGKSVAEVRAAWREQVMKRLKQQRSPSEEAAATILNNASFMTLDEYKNSVGAAAFDIHTRFVEPAFPVPPA